METSEANFFCLWCTNCIRTSASFLSTKGSKLVAKVSKQNRWKLKNRRVHFWHMLFSGSLQIIFYRSTTSQFPGQFPVVSNKDVINPHELKVSFSLLFWTPLVCCADTTNLSSFAFIFIQSKYLNRIVRAWMLRF